VEEEAVRMMSLTYSRIYVVCSVDLKIKREVSLLEGIKPMV
jgi:hypothetical protein